MSIYPDKKAGQLTGRWRVEVQLGGLRKRGRFASHDDAKRAEKDWTAELASGAPTDATPRLDHLTPRTISQLLLKASPMLWSGSSHGDLSEGKVRWIVKECGDPQLDRIPTDYVDRAVIKLRAAGKAPGTINRYLSALHAVLGWGAKPGRRLVPVMPEFSWQDEDEGRIRYLTPPEEDRLVRTLQALGYAEIADLCIVALDTGCRRGELLSAARHQLDGKWLRLWHTKSGHPRSVPLTDRSRAILEARLPFKVKEHQLRYAWEKAKTAMGMSQDEDFVFHCLRHTRATRLVELGVNLRVIQQFMGHRSIQTTLRYAHVSDDMLADAVSRMDSANALLDANHLTRRVGVPEVPAVPLHAQGAVLEPVE